MTPRRAIIVGGGVGGLAAGLALRRIGVDVKICERETDLSRAQAGGCFSLYANALRALHELGIGRQVEEVGSRLQVTEMRTKEGALLGVAPLTGLEHRFEAPNIGTSRTETHRILTAAVGEDAIRLGAACTGFAQDDSGVSVRFADGSEEHGDLLVGADGLHSTIRKQQFGEEPPRYAGYTVWQGIAEESLPGLRVDSMALWYGRGLRFAVYHIGRGRPYWAALLTTEPGGRDAEGRSKEAVAALFTDWAEPISELIEMTPDSVISRMDNFGRDPLPTWGTGRVTLLGDAAHPTTINIGQGACQAIEDAFALGECLRREPSSERALRAYEGCRAKRTKEVMALAWRVGAVGQWSNPLAVQVRKYVLKLGWKRIIGPGYDRIIGSVDLHCGGEPGERSAGARAG